MLFVPFSGCFVAITLKRDHCMLSSSTICIPMYSKPGYPTVQKVTLNHRAAAKQNKTKICNHKQNALNRKLNALTDLLADCYY